MSWLYPQVTARRVNRPASFSSRVLPTEFWNFDPTEEASVVAGTPDHASSRGIATASAIGRPYCARNQAAAEPSASSASERTIRPPMAPSANRALRRSPNG